MDDLRDTIIKISNTFLDEAKKSISLLEDMAAMEKYMAESYCGRVFIELIQNADDCESKRISLCQIGNDLYFANDGKPFSHTDIVAICRSGSSYKKRGVSIGYRGVGFKSTTSLTDEVLIFSSDVLFSFSKQHAAEQLGLPTDSVPTVRIPFLINEVDQRTKKNILFFIKNHYSTVFVFKNANMNNLLSELLEADSDIFLFLKSIEECYIDVINLNRHFVMTRNVFNGYILFTSKDQHWRIYSRNVISLAFKEDAGHIVPCSENESVFHCFLPTLDKAPFLFKINADFSTDPSRKHIVVDNTTNIAIHSLVDVLCSIVEGILNGNPDMDSRFLTFLLKQHSFSILNQKIYSDFKERTSHIEVEIQNGTKIKLSEYKCLPEYLDPSEKNIIRQNSAIISETSLPNQVYINYYEVDEFIATYSNEEYSCDDLINVLCEEKLIDLLPNETIIKIGTSIIRKGYRDNRLFGKSQDLSRIIPNLKHKKNDHNESVLLNSLIMSLNGAERLYLESASGMQFEASDSNGDYSLFSSNKCENINMRNVKPSFPKWRSAEQRVVLLEKAMGYNAYDVSRMNVGYDVESTTRTGEKRYIEVKSLSNGTTEFAITNNEYTAAHQKGKNYYICLVFENKALYICDPLRNLVFIKRVRQWEWVCDDFTGEEIEFDIT